MQLLEIWDRLRTSFWFLPSAMAATAIALSFGMIELDNMLGSTLARNLDWIYTFGPEGARAILSAIATSMITVAGLTFSITMLTLQLASSQFGPRLLRNFMRDRGNQLVLGTFLSTFLYCLLVLRTVRGVDDASFVPHVSVAGGVLLAIASIAVLIYFIHHVATSIRIETLLAELAGETRCAIDRLYPQELGRGAPARREDDDPQAPLPDDFHRGARTVRVDASGYIQAIDGDALMRIACEHDLIVRIEARPGRFVTERDPVFCAYPRERVPDETVRQLRAVVVVGRDRSPLQDLEFSVRRIVEIAQRALSPGINDPTTALYCIDRLDEAFGRLARRALPSPVRRDENGRLRVVSEVVALDELACNAFAAIGRYALADADVISRLLPAMGRLAAVAPPATRESLLALGAAIALASEGRLKLSFDRRSVSAAAKLAGHIHRPARATD
ncbi:MAG: DUF2254 domain-containing protein [Burkholderiaceae bacterium]|nr:DUF2254 domain-containing protein [Burkholderiaceae bacterium]